MEKEELRIGNYYLHDGDVTKVTLQTFQDMEFDNSYIGEAIELNEEWLLKFGFQSYHQGYIIGEHWAYPLFITMDRFGYVMKIFSDENGALCSPTLKHVNQLQNLYYALTGEELKIQEL